MVTRGQHEAEISAAQAMDRSLRTYFYIRSSAEWLALRDRLRDKIQWYVRKVVQSLTVSDASFPATENKLDKTII